MGLKVDKTMDAQGFLKHLVSKKTVKESSPITAKKKSVRSRNLTFDYSTKELHSKVASSLLGAMIPYAGKTWRLPPNTTLDPLP